MHFSNCNRRLAFGVVTSARNSFINILAESVFGDNSHAMLTFVSFWAYNSREFTRVALRAQWQLERPLQIISRILALSTVWHADRVVRRRAKILLATPSASISGAESGRVHWWRRCMACCSQTNERCRNGRWNACIIDGQRVHHSSERSPPFPSFWHSVEWLGCSTHLFSFTFFLSFSFFLLFSS